MLPAPAGNGRVCHVCVEVSMSGSSEALKVIAARCSVRRFADRRVPTEAIEQIIDAARRAPTARNVQPWAFVVVTDADTRRWIADTTDHGKFIAEAPACVVVLCADTKYYLEDGCAAVENLMLAATALGVGSCWVAGDKKAYAAKIVSKVGAGQEMKLVALVALGYAADKAEPTPKRPLDDVLHWEKW